MIVNHEAIVVRPPWTQAATGLELFVALGTVAVVLELTRRTLGYTITALCLVFIAYGFVGPYLRFVDVLRPLAHRGVGINEFVDQMYFSFEGIFGTALGVSTEFIFLFVVFRRGPCRSSAAATSSSTSPARPPAAAAAARPRCR